MTGNEDTIRSALAAAAIAIVIWLILSFIFGGISGSSRALWAVIFAIIAFVGTWVISTIIERRKGGHTNTPERQ